MLQEPMMNRLTAMRLLGMVDALKAQEQDRVPVGISVRLRRNPQATADFSRSRNADLGRFTLDRLMSIVNRLGSRIEVKVRVRRESSTPRRTDAGVIVV